MRQINFLLIFASCLALVLFGLQNTEPVSIQVIQGVSVQAPLCVELIIAMGIGAVLAWFFSIWTHLQYFLESRGKNRQIQQQDDRIKDLEQDVTRFQAELEAKQNLLPASPTVTNDVEAVNVYAD